MTTCKRLTTSLKGMLAALVLSVLSLSFANAAHAANAADINLDAKGSISVTMKEREANRLIPGGELTLYHVATVAIDDANLSYELTSDFAGSGISLATLDEDNLAPDLYNWANQQHISGVVRSIPQSATLTFTDLEVGLYLVVQSTPAEGYNPVMPFVVSMPAQQGSVWVYNVDATPKVETYSVAPSSPPTPSSPPASDTPKPTGDLPQTGQLNWPIPFLFGFGILFVVVGSFLLFKRARA